MSWQEEGTKDIFRWLSVIYGAVDGTDAIKEDENGIPGIVEHCIGGRGDEKLGFKEVDAIDEGTHSDAVINPNIGEASSSGFCTLFCIVKGDDTVDGE